MGKIAIIIGGANCVWNDYEQWKHLALSYELELQAKLGNPEYVCIQFETFVINDSIPLFDDFIDNAVTLHPYKLKYWAHDRNVRGLNIPPKVWAHRTDSLVTNHTGDWGGSSGLFACKIALELQFNKIILCGVPMTAEQQHIVRKADWNACKAFQRGWHTRMETIKGLVKSYSGWTKDQLGEPTLEWLGN